MKRQIREQLVKLATDIITSREDRELTELYEVSKELYEKLAVLKFIDEKLSDVEVDVSKNVLATRFEKLATSVMSGNTGVPESNPHEEDIITHPGMDTIRDMVSEMPTEAIEHIFGDFIAKPDTMKNEKEILSPEAEPKSPKAKSLNDKLTTKKLQIGLNDKLAFVKHLFHDNMEDYNRVLSQLNTIETEERSVAFINNMVKPEYNNWEGKEEYASRFMDHVARKFA